MAGTPEHQQTPAAAGTLPDPVPCSYTLTHSHHSTAHLCRPKPAATSHISRAKETHGLTIPRASVSLAHAEDISKAFHGPDFSVFSEIGAKLNNVMCME